MAQTVAEITTEYEADPRYATLTDTVNGETLALSAAERSARLDEWAVNERQRQLDAEAEAQRKEVRRQVRLARTILQDDIAFFTAQGTAAQVRAGLVRTDRILLGLIDALIDLALIERTD